MHSVNKTAPKTLNVIGLQIVLLRITYLLPTSVRPVSSNDDVCLTDTPL